MSHYKRAKVTVDAYVYETGNGQFYVSTNGETEGQFGSLGDYEGCPAGTVSVEWAEPDITFEDRFVAFRPGAHPIIRDHRGAWWLRGGSLSSARDAGIRDGVEHAGYLVFNPNGEQVAP